MFSKDFIINFLSEVNILGLVVKNAVKIGIIDSLGFPFVNQRVIRFLRETWKRYLIEDYQIYKNAFLYMLLTLSLFKKEIYFST